MSRAFLVFLLAAGTAASVLCVFGWAPMRALAMNSDLIVPLSYAWDAVHEPGGIGHYRLSRLPSLVPDGVFSLAGFAVAGISRASVLVYGMLQLGAFLLAGGAVAAGLAGRRLLPAAAMLFGAFAALLGFELEWGEDPFLLAAFLPIIHFGPFLGVLLGGWALARALHRPRPIGQGLPVLVASCSALVFTSDKLILPELVLPGLVAGALARAVDGVAWSRLAAVFGAMAAGLLVGDLGFQLVRHAVPLRFQGPPVLSAAGVEASVRAFAGGLPGFVAQDRIGVATGLLLPLVGWACFPLCWRDMAPASRRAARSCWVLATASMPMALCFAACLYRDTSSYRYALSCWVWPLLFSAALLLRALPAAAPAAVAGTAVAALGTLFLGPQGGAVPILAWEHPLARCVRELRPGLGLRAGLAEYWVARPVEFSLDYAVQLDQVIGPGVAFPWLNDARWYRRDLHDPRRPPAYNFIVMQGLDPEGVRARYGMPARVVPCGGTEFWVYADPDALRREVLGSDPELGGPG